MWAQDEECLQLQARRCVVAVQSLSCIWLFVTSWTAMCQVLLSFTMSWSLLRFMSIESVMLSNHLILCHPLLRSLSIFPASGPFSVSLVFASGGFNISPSNEYSGLISCRIEWFDLLTVQETLKSLLQHHNLKPWILQCSAFSLVQLLHPYMTAGKTIASTIWTFVGRLMSVLFNILSRFVIAFLPRSIF